MPLPAVHPCAARKDAFFWPHYHFSCWHQSAHRQCGQSRLARVIGPDDPGPPARGKWLFYFFTAARLSEKRPELYHSNLVL